MHHHVHKKTGPAVKEWELLWALFTTHDPHQQELICNELLQLPAARINCYLLEYVYLAVSRPSGPLERAITELCGRSFNTAVQVSWLLLALLEDQPGNRHIQHFRDACERAALTGGQPSQPHYLQTFTQQQLYQQPSPYSSSSSAVTSASGSAAAAAEAEAASAVVTAEAQATEAQAAALQVASNGALAPRDVSNSDASSAAASPFAVTAASAFNSSRPSSPCRSPSAVMASAASVGSLSGSHRFRDSLDLELMQHASQNLASTAGRTPTGLQQQQYQGNATTSAQKRARRQQQSASNSSPDKQPQEQKQHQRLEVGQQSDQLAITGIPNGLASIRTSSNGGHGSSRQHTNQGGRSPHARCWAVPGSVAAGYSSFDEYFAARDTQLSAELGKDQGVGQLIAASHEVAVHNTPHGVGWLVTHEEELMSTSMLLEMPPRSPRHAAGRDSYLATLDFVEALCETSSSLTRFAPAERRKVLRRCLARINQEVMDAAEQGVAVRYPVGGCRSRVLRLLANDAVILNSRDKAPFLLMLEVQEDADFVDEVLPGGSSSKAAHSISPVRSLGSFAPHAVQRPESVSAAAAGGTSDVLPCSPDQQQQEHTSRPLPSRQQQLLQQLYNHPQQQRRPHSAHQGPPVVAGTSPLSRSSSPAPTSPQQQQQQQQHLQEQQQEVTGAAAPPTIFAAAAAGGGGAGGGEPVSPQEAHINSGIAAPAADCSTSIPAVLAPGSATAMQRLQQQLSVAEQQQQQQQERLQQLNTATLRGGDASMAGVQEQQRSSSPAPHPAVAAAAAAPVHASAAPAAPTRLELQMQEAAAVLRGEKLIRLHIAVMQPAKGAAGSSSNNSIDNRRQHSAASDDDDSCLGPWVFGELPAGSSSEDISKQAAAAATGGVGTASTGVSRRLRAMCNSNCQGQLVSVQLEVVESAPVAQQLSLHHKTRRRLPSMEAIDIIAGKLGKADIPPPTEIGPPLQLHTELSTSSRSSSGSIDADLICNAPLSPAPLATVTEGVPAFGEADTTATDELQAPATAGEAAELSSSTSDSNRASKLSDPPAATAAAAAAAGAVPLDEGSTHRAQSAQARHWKTAVKPEWQRQVAANAATAQGLAVQVPSALQEPGRHQQQQQQPHKSGAGWWGFLRKQQQLGPSPRALQQQQQHGYLQGPQAELDAAAEAEALAKQADQVYGERWAARAARLRATSPFGSRPGWGLAGVIVKSGDDCRQELLALQLIRELGEIWAGADLPLWVLPFEVLVTSSGTALIQLIPDATSVHSIKVHMTKYSSTAAGTSPAGVSAAPGSRTPRKARQTAAGSVSLSDHFFAKWKRGSPECLAAQRRFVESLAGYSLVTYLLQVKDRHNGNIMMDSEGHLIHIDYGFMLSNAPGGNWVRFEAAPMKLTRELLEVMDSDSEGQTSDLFDYFKVLCIQGFLAARKQRHRLVGLVRIMADCSRPGALSPTGPFGIPPSSNKPASSSSTSNSGIQAPSWPCFQAGADRVVAALESRFAPQLSEGACVQHVLRLISSSLDAWSTRQYDYYQRVLNGIL